MVGGLLSASYFWRKDHLLFLGWKHPEHARCHLLVYTGRCHAARDILSVLRVESGESLLWKKSKKHLGVFMGRFLKTSFIFV